METNFAILEKRAIEAALKNNWEKALELNTQILNRKPSDVSARIRLGKAQIQTKNFKDALKTFKAVLEKDPINQIALKNLKIAKEGKVSNTVLQTKKLIKEPGTTTEVQVVSKKKNLNLEVGDILSLNIKKNGTEVFKDKVLVGVIADKDVTKGLNAAKNEKVPVEASFIKQKGENIILLLVAPLPVFKSAKQDVKPYFKKGTIEDEEPELDFGNEDSPEE